jgi:hypothetical protein
MGELARAITLVTAAAGRKSELISDPIYRFDEPARHFSNGSLWAFKTGRPDALLCLSLQKNNRNQLMWIQELTSLSDGPVAASSRHRSSPCGWNPRDPGVVLRPIPRESPPAGDDGRRLRKMREAVRRFQASESLDPVRNDPSDRVELRLLPQPVLRYRDPDAELVDGAIFVMAHGGNLELALLIEAGRKDRGDSAWLYGLARIGAARLRVRLDDRKVDDRPKPAVAGWRNPYFLYERPALGLAD